MGYKHSSQAREAMRQSKLGNRNPMWKGALFGNNALHLWVKAHLKKSPVCDSCNSVPPRDLANKGIYDRDFANWEWLCRRCHMRKDGRLERYKKTSFKRG